MLARNHFYHGATKAPDIDLFAILLFWAHKLWRHPVERPMLDSGVPDHRFARVTLLRELLFGEFPQNSSTSEICQLDITLDIAKDVTALNISMHNIQVVQVSNSLNKLPGVLPHQTLFEGTKLAHN